MLINLTPIKEEIERRISIAKEHNFEYYPQSDPKFLIDTGIYQSTFAFNFPKEEFEEFKDFSTSANYEIFDYDKITYGVADNVEQIKHYYKDEIADPDNKYVIAVTPVWQDKSNAGKGGGWRWHKWGKYIGELDSKCEYLDDEDFGDGFEYILTFSIYKV
jgi:hypothetical protein